MQGIRLGGAILAMLLVLGCGVALAAQDDPAQGPAAAALSAPPQTDPGVELVGERTATSETFRLPDGELQTRIYESPIHYLDAEGEWRPIGDRLEETQRGGLTNGPNRFDVSLPDRLGADPVRLTVEGEWVSAELLGPDSEAAQLEGDAASYESADGGTTFEFANLPNGLKEDIVIAAASQPSSFSFDLDASDGLAPDLAKDGSIAFRDGEGQAIVVLPAPIVSDSAPGQPAISDAVHYDLEPREEGGWRLTVEVDRSWLEQPDRVWPARIDPTLTVPSPSLDCTYWGLKTNGGICGSQGGQKLAAGYLPNPEPSNDEWRRSLLRFDLSAIPATAYVDSATLGLYSPTTAKNTSGVEVRRALRDWTNLVNWTRYSGSSWWTNEGGDFSSSEGASVLTSERGSAAGWWNFSAASLTSLVQTWVSKAVSNQGLLVKLLDDKSRECGSSSCTERLVEFNSSASSNPSLRPYMTIVHNPRAPSTSKVVLPQDGTQTARRLKLKAAWSVAGVTGVTFQYRRGDDGPFLTAPASYVRDAQGQQPSWPIAVEGVKQTEPLYFDLTSADPQLREKGGPIEVRAQFEGPTGVAGVSAPVKATVDTNIGGTRDATAPIGPGTVNLLTGNFSVTRTDVSIPVFDSALEFARVHSSREPGADADTGVLGRGWKPAALVEAAGGASWRSLRVLTATEEEKEEGLWGYALLKDLEGYEYAFEQNEAGVFISPPEAAGWSLYRLSATQIAFTDPDGNRTIFDSSGGSEYLPVSVSMTGGSNNKTQMVYKIVNGNRRLHMVIAPSAASIECTETNATITVGCRSLVFSYLPASAWGAPSAYKDRLSAITYHAWSSGSSMGQWEVAKYKYDSAGRLVAQWDPRISPPLEETYAYKGEGATVEGGQIKTITPPGEEAWTLEYGALKGEPASAGRLLNVKRPSLLSEPSVAQTTIAYEVPVSGSGAPYDMSASAVGQWGQQDLPADATAIFPPDEVPSSPPTSYSRATVHYMEVEGQLVNTATPSGAGTSAPSISTTETDENGNVIRQLSPQNRLRALAEGSNSVTHSQKIDTKRLFSSDGTELLEEWGPLHEVRLESGETVQARRHTTIQYDDGAPKPPAGTPMPQLPTRETTGASIPGKGIDADQRVTETKYDWTLRKPTDVIVDAVSGGLNLRTHMEYDAETGLLIERRLPAKPDGGDARTTKIVYYWAGGNGVDVDCKVKDQAGLHLANLPCKVLPAAQPGTPGQPELLVKKYLSYSPLGQPTQVVESPGGGSANTRETIRAYDTAGRLISTKQEGGGVSIPTTEIVYHKVTGRPTTQRFACESECTSGTKYSSSFGSSGSGNGQFAHPAGSAIDAQGNLWVVDSNNNRVQKFDSEGKYVTQLGSLGSGNGQLSDPMDIAIDDKGNLWIADRGNHRVQKLNAKGEYLAKFGSLGSGNGQFSSYGPRGIAIDAQGDLWVSDYSGRVQEFNANGEFVKAVGSYGSGEGQFGESTGLDIEEGKVWVGDWTKHRVSVFSDAGKFLFQFGSSGSGNGQFNHPDAVEVDSKGNVWVIDEGNGRFQQFNSEGKYVGQFGSKGSGAGQFSFAWPVGIASDSSGNVWISDSANNRVQKWVPSSSFDAQATTTAYDTLGRPISYEDADGNVSSTGYDLLGRPLTTSDGKGIQTMTYDPTSGLPVQLTDSAAGTFTASYDADGNLVERGLPNGLVAKATYDEIGAPVHLSYDKVTNCASNCTWLDFDVEESIHGQWLNQTSTLSSQQYSYDKAGRLTLVKDTPQDGSCTTRSYSYDADSNRTSLITRQPDIGGACDTSSSGNVQSYSYDAGDRLLGSEIAYDNYGRITILRSAYSGGGTLTSTYYSNDLVRSQTQDGITNTYELDAALRKRQRTQSGGSGGTEIYHYAGDSDSPAWIDRGTAWSRNITGIGGELAAIQDSATGTTLQLTNLHGDMVATASLSIEATKPLATFEFDEFGNPKAGSAGKYGWLGGKQRRTELPSGVIQMGVRSYVPAMGRFTSVDPVTGGSANAYDYANADPVSNFDVEGTVVEGGIKCTQRAPRPHKSIHRPGRVNAVGTINCRSFGNTAGEIVRGTITATLFRNGRQVSSSGPRHFEVYALPTGKPGFKIPVNVPCKNGIYWLHVSVVVNYPPGFVPPTVKNSARSRSVVIRC